jgi:hypothetical protein
MGRKSSLLSALRFLLASKSKTARISILPILSVVRESFPMLASGYPSLIGFLPVCRDSGVIEAIKVLRGREWHSSISRQTAK